MIRQKIKKVREEGEGSERKKTKRESADRA